MFENLKAGDITNLGKIGLNIKTHASPKVGPDLGSGGVSDLCRLAASVANVLRIFYGKFAQAKYKYNKTDSEK